MAKKARPEEAPQRPEEILTDVQVMERLQIGKTTLSLLIDRKNDPLPCSRIKTRTDGKIPILRFIWSKVEAWLERQEEP